MGVTDRPAGQHCPIAIANADIRRLAVGVLLTNVKHAILVPGHVVRPTHVGPHADELSSGGEDLHAPVGTVTDVDPAVRCDQNAMRQVELTGSGLAWLAPGVDEPAVTRKPVHASVAIAIGNVNIAGGAWHHLGGVVKRTS